MANTKEKAKTATSQLPPIYQLATVAKTSESGALLEGLNASGDYEADLSRIWQEKNSTVIINGKKLNSSEISALITAFGASGALVSQAVSPSPKALEAFLASINQQALLFRPQIVYKENRKQSLLAVEDESTPTRSTGIIGEDNSIILTFEADTTPTQKIFRITTLADGGIIYEPTFHFRTKESTSATYLFDPQGQVHCLTHVPLQTKSQTAFAASLPKDITLEQLQASARILAQQQLKELFLAPNYQAQLTNDFAQFQAATHAGWFTNSPAKQALAAKVQALQQTGTQPDDSQRAFLCAYELIAALEGLLLARATQPTAVVQKTLEDAQAKLARFKNNSFYPQLQALFNEVCSAVYSAGALPKPLPFFRNTPVQQKLAAIEEELSQHAVKPVAQQLGWDITTGITFGNLVTAAYPLTGKADPSAQAFLQALNNYVAGDLDNNQATELNFLCQAYKAFTESSDTKRAVQIQAQTLQAAKPTSKNGAFNSFVTSLLTPSQTPKAESLAVDAEGIRQELLDNQQQLATDFLIPEDQQPRTTVLQSAFANISLPNNWSKNKKSPHVQKTLNLIESLSLNDAHDDFKLLRLYFSKKIITNSIYREAYQFFKDQVAETVKTLRNTRTHSPEQKQFLALHDLMSVKVSTNDELTELCKIGDRSTGYFLSRAQTVLRHALFRLNGIACVTAQQKDRKDKLTRGYQQSLELVNQQLAIKFLGSPELKPLLVNLANYLEIEHNLLNKQQQLIQKLQEIHGARETLGAHKAQLANIVVQFAAGKFDQRDLCTQIQLCFQDNGANLVGFFGTIKRWWGRVSHLLSKSPEKHRISTAPLLQEIANQALEDTARAIATHYQQPEAKPSSYAKQLQVTYMVETPTFKVENDLREKQPSDEEVDVKKAKKQQKQFNKALNKAFKQERRAVSEKFTKKSDRKNAAKDFDRLKALQLREKEHQLLFSQEEKESTLRGDEIGQLAKNELVAHTLSTQMVRVR